jgi:hypothetical protein
MMDGVAAIQSDSPTPDLLTIVAIALAAYAASNFVHEAVGHGGACLVLHGKALVLSSVHFECGEEGMSKLALRGVAAGGTMVNFAAGAAALAGFQKTDALRRPHAAYFLWLFATLNLLSGAGYFLFSGIGGIGDWADVAGGVMPAVVWRPAMSVIGGALYFLLARQAAQWLRSLAGGGALSMKRGKVLTVPAYLAGGLLYCVAGLFNPVGPILIAISAAASSFGGGSGLVWMTQFLRGDKHAELAAAALGRSYGWMAAGGVAALIFVAILGPGIRF